MTDAPSRPEPTGPVADSRPEPASPLAVQDPNSVNSPYRGREGKWSWVAHRITGILTFFFLLAHVLDVSMVRVSPESYDQVADIYKNPAVNLLEVVLVGAVLFHALNGLRIVAIDLWERVARYERESLSLVVLVWVIVMVPTAYFMYRYSAEQLFGSK